MRVVISSLVVLVIAGPVAKLRQSQSGVSSTTAPQPREAHWPKQSPDRAAELKQHVTAQRKSEPVP
jgi:hypothetical protein